MPACRPPAAAPATSHAKRAPPRGRCLAAAASPPPLPELDAAVERLWAVRQVEVTPQEDLDAALAEVEALAAAAGVNRVLPELNDGVFRGYTLQGKLRGELAAGAVTLGRLSFGLYRPGDLLVDLQGASDLATVTKGPWPGRPGGADSYVVSTPFEVASQPGQYGQYSGLRGISHAIARYERCASSPQRLDIRFNALRLAPAPGQTADLARWLDLFAPHNPLMIPGGELEVELPEQASPKGWLDHLLMLPGWQITQGNMGSKTLLRRLS